MEWPTLFRLPDGVLASLIAYALHLWYAVGLGAVIWLLWKRH